MNNRYQVYPSLLNSFGMYMREEGYEKDDDFILFVTQESLIDQINRVRTPTTEKQQRGNDFEANLLDMDLPETDPWFPLIQNFREYLPDFVATQVFVENTIDTRFGPVRIYGYADIVGAPKVQDVKTTSKYEFPRFLRSHQLWYMKGLEQYGINQMDFLVTDFHDIFKETYHLKTYDWNILTEEVESFIHFLESNREHITDTKIFCKNG